MVSDVVLPELFVPVLAWPGRRPSLAELGTWHEALRGAVGTVMPVDLLACWLYPSRGGSVLVGPRDLAGDDIVPPPAEPIVSQESIFALEDRIAQGGYKSVMAVPIRSEVQDVGMLVVGAFAENAYQLSTQRALHRFAGQIATSCRRLAAQAWVIPQPIGDDRTSMIAGVTEGLLDAMGRARDGNELVQLASDALANQLPHDRLELLAAAPAPDRWTMLALDRAIAPQWRPDSDATDAIDGLVHHFGGRDLLRIDDIRTIDRPWPVASDHRGAERLRSVLAARLEVAGDFVGWLCLASETPGWFSEEDEAVARLTARILAPRVAAWEARAELAGAWA
ncbi:MAG TPA: GAF domain-containing protein [Gemmatimonadales bacterium]|jgi:GAF domain-containing protein